MNTSRLLIVVLLIAGAARAFGGDESSRGKIVGRVTDRESRQPIPGANVLVEGTPLGSSTRPDGRFEIPLVPVGTYTLRFSCVGYGSVRVSDVVVATGHPVQVEPALQEESLSNVGEVVARGALFAKPDEVTTSAYGLNYEEIRRAPGALGDVDRIVQSMPGVVPTNDQRNDLVVRGGSPSENLTVVDNVDVPNLSHFGTQGASGGPISMLNTEFIREANFMAGGFPARFGGKLSSVLDVSLREGNREQVSGDADLSISGAGGLVEGPIGEQGSWMLAARRSFLDLIFGSYGLTAVPRYSNYQAKATEDLDPANKLWFVSIGGIDKIEFSADSHPMDNYSSMNIISGGWRTISGINWQMLWGKHGYGVLGLSDALDVFDQQARDALLQDQLVFRNSSREGTTTLKYDGVLNVEGAGEFTFGAAARVLRNTLDVQQPIGVSDMWSASSQRLDTLSLQSRPVLHDYAAYAQWSGDLLRRMKVTAGLRFETFGYAGDAGSLEPRIGLSYAIDTDVSVNASYGIFRQMPPVVFLEAAPGNELLRPIRADHYVLGLSAFPRPDLKVSVEAYIKRYSDYPVSDDHPTFSLANAGDDYSISGYLFPMVSAGRGEARGVEFYLQKKLVDRLYGQISYSFSRARYAGLDGVMRPGSFDIPNVLSVVGGYKLSDAWECSAKFTYATGRPFTPLDLAASAAQNRLILDVARTNAERLPDYHRLDVRADYRAQFSGWSLVSYVEIQNVYNRKNLFMYVWDAKTGKQVITTQVGFFPVGGFVIEF